MKKLLFSLKALSNERRLNILIYISRHRKSVSDIAEYLKISLPTASFHLRKLLREGYVIIERQKKIIWYSIPKKILNSNIYKQIKDSI